MIKPFFLESVVRFPNWTMEWDAGIARNAPEEAEVYRCGLICDIDADFMANLHVWWWL